MSLRARDPSSGSLCWKDEASLGGHDHDDKESRASTLQSEWIPLADGSVLTHAYRLVSPDRKPTASSVRNLCRLGKSRGYLHARPNNRRGCSRPPLLRTSSLRGCQRSPQGQTRGRSSQSGIAGCPDKSCHPGTAGQAEGHERDLARDLLIRRFAGLAGRRSEPQWPRSPASCFPLDPRGRRSGCPPTSPPAAGPPGWPKSTP
jgi:hypothetical protein